MKGYDTECGYMGYVEGRYMLFASERGYDTECGYMGYVEGRYMLFASEREYIEFVRG